MFKLFKKESVKEFNSKEIISRISSSFVNSFYPFSLKENVIYYKKNEIKIKDFSFELYDYQNSTDVVFDHYEDICFFSDKEIIDNSSKRFDLIVLRNGKIGREYNKTFSQVLKNDSDFGELVIQVLNGSGYIVLEEHGKDKEIKVIKVNRDSFVVVPKKTSFVLINTGNELLISQLMYEKSFYLNKFSLRDSNGSSLYFTDKGFIRNRNSSPHYFLDDIEGNFLNGQDYNPEINLYDDYKISANSLKEIKLEN